MGEGARRSSSCGEAHVNDAFKVDAPNEALVEPLTYRADERQQERRGEIPALYKTAHERLACDLALDMAHPEEVFASHGLSAQQALELTDSPAFTAMCKRIAGEIRENGLSFRMKAKAISEELLVDAFEIATDPLQSGAVRAKIIEWVAKVAGNEPAPAKGVVDGGGGFSLSITFAGQEPQQVLAEGRTLEHQP
jgi:hypothetical protein